MAAEAKKIVLITGANSGIGYALAAALLARENYHVLLGSRTKEKGLAAVKSLQYQNLPGSVEYIEIDVTSESSIAAAVAVVEKVYGHLDVLVNNAGVAPENGTMRERMTACFATNAMGPAVVVEAFAPLLLKSSVMPRVVNVSSGLGSIELRLNSDKDGMAYKLKGEHYRVSKAALNMVTANQHVEFGEKMKVFAVCPGWVASNLGPANTIENGAADPNKAVVPLVEILEGKRDAEAGQFLHRDGSYPW